jgi:hypothetical protein
VTLIERGVRAQAVQIAVAFDVFNPIAFAFVQHNIKGL